MTSRPQTAGKLPLTDIADMKRRGERIVMVTATTTTPGGRLADAAGWTSCSSATPRPWTVLGHESTVPATMDEMVTMPRQRRPLAAPRRPIVVADMPFGSFQTSDEEAVRNADRFVKVKRRWCCIGAGTRPCRVRSSSRARRSRHPRDEPRRSGPAVLDDARRLPRARANRSEGESALEDARTLEAAGLLLGRARGRSAPRSPPRITESLTVPTIGIGSGASCDGQVLVFHDLLGLYEGRCPGSSSATRRWPPTIQDALERYAADVRTGAFPATSTRTPSRRRSWPRSRLSGSRAGIRNGNVTIEHAEHHQRQRNEGAADAPAFDDRDPVDQRPNAQRPKRPRTQSNTRRAGAVVVASPTGRGRGRRSRGAAARRGRARARAARLRRRG